MPGDILALRNLTKVYPGVTALDNVSMTFSQGEIHAIIGENGAGKSTLIKCITGCIQPTGGEIEFDSALYSHVTPTEAIAKGIGSVYQEFNLVPYLSVSENIFYGREIKKRLFLDYDAMHAQTSEIMRSLGLSIDPKMRVMDLSVAYQQLAEIAKAVSRDVKLLILDEPSAPLTEPEIKAMFEILRKLKAKGVTILYISHRLEEIFQIADRVSIMRDGCYIATHNVGEIDRASLIRQMVGRELADVYPERSGSLGEVVLKAEKLSNYYLKGVSFSVRAGEILGFGGLVGAGRTETARAIFGADPLETGTVSISGKAVRVQSPKGAIDLGIGLMPEDRKQHGLLLKLSVSDNIAFSSLRSMARHGFIHKKQESAVIDARIADLQIKTPSSAQLVRNLSGGNQQKVVLAKWLTTKCKLLIFDEPTRGIDVGAKQEIHKLMRKLCEEGMAIIMISSDMPELLGMSDRIIVMHEGKVTGELSREDATQERMLDLASGNA